MIIDSHCHLDYEPLVDNLDQVLLNAKQNNIEKVSRFAVISRPPVRTNT